MILRDIIIQKKHLKNKSSEEQDEISEKIIKAVVAKTITDFIRFDKNCTIDEAIKCLDDVECLKKVKILDVLKEKPNLFITIFNKNLDESIK